MISIIIPTFNRVASLEKCLNSIVPQFFEGLEVLVIDDHSSDNTRTLLETFSSRHTFIKPFYNPSNQGVNYTRNRGIEKASENFIFFLDSDDWLLPGALQTMADTIKKFPHVLHFLFLVSDRSEEFSHVSAPIPVEYAEWVSTKVKGDFSHVVQTEIMKRNLFFEQFRMFEVLNWFRVMKLTSPQLLIPVVTTERERNRADGLITSMKKKDIQTIKAKFNAQVLFYSMYYQDLMQYRPGAFGLPILKIILLGIVCDQKKDCNKLIQLIKKPYIKTLALMVTFIPSPIVKKLVLKG